MNLETRPTAEEIEGMLGLQPGLPRRHPRLYGENLVGAYRRAGCKHRRPAAILRVDYGYR
jgi:hypothetical protein